MASLFEQPTNIKLPGFGLPYDNWGEDREDYAKRLSAVQGWTHAVTSIRERCMLFLIDRLTDKPDWTRKVHDKDIVNKWKQEAKELDWSKVIEGGSMTDETLDHCIDELRYKANLYEKAGIIPVLDASSCVLKSDSVISNELKEELKRAIAPLENVPENKKDWHPGSDNTVLDLVHPSLFPLVYGRSRILPDSTINTENCFKSIGKGVVVPFPLHQPGASSSTGLEHGSNPAQWLASDRGLGNGGTMAFDTSPREIWSRRFQWLPCNVSFPDGENAQIDSYINNLHPVDHKDLYRVIEKIITKTVPLWNIVCQSFSCGGILETFPRVECSEIEYTYPDGFDEAASADSDEDEEDFYENQEGRRIYQIPEPKEFNYYPITVDDVEKKFTFLHLDDDKAEKKFQVIVKLANIHLTPENPKYNGGSWHVEGQLNEHIVASALYYYDNSNITDSRLHFRTRVDACHFADDIQYEQDDSLGFKTIFGFERDDRNEQQLGSVLTREDRLIAFPNGFQHRVGNFQLIDPTKPGQRKILALFLVAPKIPIISTANVPPQQHDWWAREVKLDDSRIGELPAELIEMITGAVEDFPIKLEDAKVIREELMVERGKMNDAVEQEMWNESFNFCEH